MARVVIPKYRKQKRRGRPDLAFIEIDGSRTYVGEFGSEKSRDEYARLIGELKVGAGSLPVAAAEITVVEVAAKYWAHADTYYSDGERQNIRHALRTLTKFYGRTLAKDFGPLTLKSLRQALISQGLSRTYINAQIAKVRRVFRWGVSEELVPAKVLKAIESVDGLKRGRTEARETLPVTPAPEDHIAAVRAIVGRQIKALIDLQLFTAARPGELFIMRPMDINMSGAVWTYTPSSHKNTHRGRDRRIYVGARGQAVIRPFLDRSIDAYLFSPKESVAEFHAARRANRKTPTSCGNGPGKNRQKNPKRQPRDRYDRTSYGMAIGRACKRAGVPKWHPYQLRHNAGTRLREEFGLEVSRVILGHSKVETTQLYAEADHAKALDVMGQVG